MNMRKTLPFLLVSLLLVQSIMSITVQNVGATMGRGGATDDFSVTEITVNSSSASHWIQPDGSALLYVAKGDLVDISVEDLCTSRLRTHSWILIGPTFHFQYRT